MENFKFSQISNSLIVQVIQEVHVLVDIQEKPLNMLNSMEYALQSNIHTKEFLKLAKELMEALKYQVSLK